MEEEGYNLKVSKGRNGPGVGVQKDTHFLMSTERCVGMGTHGCKWGIAHRWEVWVTPLSQKLANLGVPQTSGPVETHLLTALDVVKDGIVEEATAINFAVSSILPPPPVCPTSLWHLAHNPSVAHTEAVPSRRTWTIVCPSDCEVYPL